MIRQSKPSIQVKDAMVVQSKRVRFNVNHDDWLILLCEQRGGM